MSTGSTFKSGSMPSKPSAPKFTKAQLDALRYAVEQIG